MVNPAEESQVKDKKPKSADNEIVFEASKDDPDALGEDQVENSSRRSEKLYQSDSLHLQSLLLEELWYIILDMLKNFPEDLRNCLNASPYFWELHRHQRVISLFPDVFETLVKWWEPRYWLKVVDTEVNQPEETDLQVEEEKDKDSGAEKVDKDDEVVEAFMEDDEGVEAVLDDDNVEENGDDDVEDLMDDDNVEENGDEEHLDVEADDDTDDEPRGRGRPETSKWEKAVRTCRLVCKSWNEAIEKCYSRQDMIGIQELKDDPDPRSPINSFFIPWVRLGVSIGSIQKAEEFMEKFGKSHHSGEKAPPKNPVLGRYMDLYTFHDSMQGLEREIEYFDTLAKLLKMFGKGIWYAKLYIRLWWMTEDQFYLKIRELLSLMPSLKYLEFERVRTSTLSPAFVVANPMPKLENILTIHVGFDSGGSVINELVKSNAHVPHLTCGPESEMGEEVGAVLSNISAFSADESSTFDVKMMEKYGSNWKLNKATVYRNSVDFQGLFQILEKNWANTLTDLEVYFFSHDGSSNILNASKDSRLNFPHLRRFHLYIRHYILLEFIQPLANLEHLEIETMDPTKSSKGLREKRDALGKDQTIQYAGFENRMHQSNIWQTLKKLKTIKMEWIDNWKGYWVYTSKGEKLVSVRRQ